MAALTALAIVTALVAAAALCRAGTALAVVLATIVLVPGTLPVPGAPGLFTIHRVVVLAALSGLLWRCLRGDVPWAVLRPPPLAYRFAFVLGVLAVVGIALLQPTTNPASAARAWQSLAAQLLLFLTVVALIRASGGPGAAVTPLVLATAAGAAIAVVEHVTGGSYARLWFHAIPQLLGRAEAQELARRDGHLRVRAAGDFTLAYAWTTAAVTPLLVVAAAKVRGRLRTVLLAAIPLVLLAITWTYSRSVTVPLLVVLLVVLLVIRDRPLQLAGAVLLAVGVVVVLAHPSALHSFSPAADQGSIDVRTARLPAVTSIAAAHPFRGVGLSGLTELGFPATDSSYLLGYGEVGAIGLAALLALLLAGCAAAYRGVLGTVGDIPAAVPGAAGAGALLLLIGAFSFDAFTTTTSAETFWVLVAIGITAADGSRVRVPSLSLSLPARIAVLAGLAAVGVALAVLAPTHRAQTWQFDTLRPYLATVEEPDYTGVQLRTTVCDVIGNDLAGRSHVDWTCLRLRTGSPGQGLLRLQAPDAAGLRELADRELALVRRIPTENALTLEAMGPARTGTPSALRTAPAWLPMLGLVWLLPVPLTRRTP